MLNSSHFFNFHVALLHLKTGNREFYNVILMQQNKYIDIILHSLVQVIIGKNQWEYFINGY